MKIYKVFWTHEAELDIDEIIEYILTDRISPAIFFFKNIKSKCKSLNINPQRYRIVPELLELGIKNYREIVYNPYRIIFKLTEYEVYIFAVVDSRRDFETFIFNRLLRK